MMMIFIFVFFTIIFIISFFFFFFPYLVFFFFSSFKKKKRKPSTLGFIHDHEMMPRKDLRKGDCCGRFRDNSDGYYCKTCDIFFHKTCSKSDLSINHPSHWHKLRLETRNGRKCSLCDRGMGNLFYCCKQCNFNTDLYCAKYPPRDFIDNSKTQGHKLTLVKPWRTEVYCYAKCGNTGGGNYYKCNECDLTFHVDCVKHPLREYRSSEVAHPLVVNHSCHLLHPLKLLTGRAPDYCDKQCRLCGKKIGKLFYHCSLCNFTLDMRCVVNPPPKSLLNLKAHDHQLTLIPSFITFTCNACGLKGDRSPYFCIECDFMVHKDCIGFPRVININRHDHRVSRVSLLGVVDSVCGVCRKKVDWTCGGYTCQRCPGYVVHSKCATRKDVWNGKELEGVPEEEEELESYVIIDDNTIQHFSHEEHNLILNKHGILLEDTKQCKACTRDISHESFYGCMDCEFILHENCVKLPRKKWHVQHNDRFTLVASEVDYFKCAACERNCNGFRYKSGNVTLDVQCGSVSEPFDHPSHPQHPLFFISPSDEGVCNGCDKSRRGVLRCFEDKCGFVLCFKCAILPPVVNHRFDANPLTLRYGEKASVKYWCEICEKETNPKTWFYTCKDHLASLHTHCVLGDCTSLMQRSTIANWQKRRFEVVVNNSMSRPCCKKCESRCMPPTILKMLGTFDTYICSVYCLRRWY